MTEILMNVPCALCKGDGYLTVTPQQWEIFQKWINDPTEDKVNSAEDFPYFLKDLHTFVSVVFGKNIVSMSCTACGGTKTVQKQLTLDDLKKLLA